MRNCPVHEISLGLHTGYIYIVQLVVHCISSKKAMGFLEKTQTDKMNNLNVL